MCSEVLTSRVVQYLTVYSNSNALWISPPPPTTSYYASEDFYDNYSCHTFYATNHGTSEHNSLLSFPPRYPSHHHFSDNTFGTRLFSTACWNFHLCRTKPVPLCFCSLNPLGMKHWLLTFQVDLLLMVPPMMVLPLTKNPLTMFHLMEKDLHPIPLVLKQNNRTSPKQSS